jgi:hypothetical protein
LPGPIEEGAELIWIGHKINDERYRGQHEDRVSHGVCPVTDVLILHATFRNQPVVKVNIIGRKFRDAAVWAGRMFKGIWMWFIPGTGASPDYAVRPDASRHDEYKNANAGRVEQGRQVALSEVRHGINVGGSLA